MKIGLDLPRKGESSSFYQDNNFSKYLREAESLSFDTKIAILENACSGI